MSAFPWAGRARRAVFLSLAAIAAAAPAHAQAASYVEGGLISWPWVWRDSASPQHYRLWTAEDGGRIRFVDLPDITQAGSASWRVFHDMSPATEAILRDVMVDPTATFGVAVGDAATWYWTANASGASAKWFAATLSIPSQWPSDVRLWDVALVSSSLAYVVGDDGLLASTTTPISSAVTLTAATFTGPAPTERLVGIEFVPGSMTGAAVGTATCDPVAGTLSGGAYWTLDGVNWSPSTLVMRDIAGNTVQATLDVQLFKLAWVPGTSPSAAVGYAVGGFGSGVGYIFRTGNGGQTWEQEHHECEGLAYSLCPNAGGCAIPAPECPAGQSNLGANKEYGQLNGLYGVATFENGATAVGYGGILMRRVNNGVGSMTNVWKEVTNRCTQTTTPLWGVHSDSANTAILCGSPEQIRISRDRGITWRNMLLEDERRRFALAYAPTSGAQGAVWTGGENARIQVSYDRGATWEVQNEVHKGDEKARDLLAIAVHRDGDADPSNDVGIAVGLPAPLQGGTTLTSTIYVTSTGGASYARGTQTCGWTRAASSGLDESETWNDVACAGVTSTGQIAFWLVGQHGRVARALYDASTGWSFQEVLHVPSVDWKAASFRSSHSGWIVGSTGAVGVAYRTANGESATPSFASALGSLVVESLTAVAADATYVIAAGANPSEVLWIDPAGSSDFVLFPNQPATTDPLNCAAILMRSGTPTAVLGGSAGEMFTCSLPTGTWTRRPTATSLNLRQMDFAVDADGFLLVHSGIDELHAGGISGVLTLR